MFVSVASASLQGIRAELVHIEVNAGEVGEPRLILVGLPDAAVRESHDRVVSALSNSGFRAPRTRTTINLAPGHVRKEGPIYDLPIALALLGATGQIDPRSLEDHLIAGELSLSGATRPIRGAIAIAQLAQELGKVSVLLPPVSAEEAALVIGQTVYRIESLASAVAMLSGKSRPLAMMARPYAREPQPALQGAPPKASGDFTEIRGQAAARRAAEVAVAGSHHLLMSGPPGSGKSMIARCLPTLMPPPEPVERLEILGIYSAAGRTLAEGPGASERPFRSPHHRATDIALIGGGAEAKPGEISLAHHGVLFLDELPEFRRSVLEVLRQPLEDGVIAIARSAAHVSLPCAFMLVAAMNPCPCGHLGDPRKRCRCTAAQIQRYRAKISGPLLDRIDLQIEVPAVSLSELRSAAPGESSAAMRVRIEAARDRQRARFVGTAISVNSRMGHAQIRRHCSLEADLGDLLQQAMERLSLSARAYDRILKVARTIADLAGAEKIEAAHLLEAIQYRALDRNVLL